MSAESLGSHQLNSFAAFLEEKLHTSSESLIVQIPHLKKMVDGKKPQKGGKKQEVMSGPDFRGINFPKSGPCAHQPQEYC